MTITPYLYYEDLPAALQWLADAFGFEREGVAMTDAEGRVAHAAMRFRDGIIMIGAPGPAYRSPRRLGGATQSLYVIVDSAEAQCERARAAGAKVLEEPNDTDYGHRRCGLEDPEGHQWYFANEL
ncbi:MAG TPA: VOC family protein [Thermoanaerobaculia bacterium]|nr:VOC family protein [Thermoanaerobaculia bacterium]